MCVCVREPNLLLKWCFLFTTEKESGESEAVEGAAQKIEGFVRMLDVEVTSELMPPKILGNFGWPPCWSPLNGDIPNKYPL